MKNVKKTLKKLQVGATCTALTIGCTAFNVFAANATPTPPEEIKGIINKIDNTKTLLGYIVSAIGGLVAAIYLLKAFKGYKNGDDRQVDVGIAGVVVGILMISFPFVMQAFGL